MSSDSSNTIQVTIKTDDVIQSLSFNQAEIVIGRGADCDIAVIDDKVSKKHLKIFNENGVVRIQDLGSSNGTFLNSGRIDNGQSVIKPGDVIHLGSIRTLVEIVVVNQAAPELQNMQVAPAPQPAIDNKNRNLKKIEDKFKAESEKVDLNFRGVQIMQPLYQNPSKHAQEILAQAELLKKSIIKGAEVRADVIINEAQKQSNKIAQEKVEEYKKNIELLLQSARLEVEKMREEAHLEVHQLKLNWETEQEQQRQEFESNLSREKNEIINTEIERLEEVYRQKIADKYKQIAQEQEAEKQSYQAIIDDYKKEILDLENQKTQFLVFEQEFKIKHDEKLKKIEELDLTLAQLEEKHSQLEQALNAKNTEKTIVQSDIESLVRKVGELRSEIENLGRDKASLKNQFDDLTRSFHIKNEELAKLVEKLEAEKSSGFRLISEEIKVKKEQEYQKLEDFKKQQVKEYQKISDDHLKSFQNLGPDISQSIAQKLEIYYKKHDKFNFEKTFEIILSSIQSHFNYSGSKNLSDIKIDDKISEIRSAQRRKQATVYFNAFVIYTVVFLSGKYALQKLNQDPLEEQRRQLAAESLQMQEKNKYVFVQDDTYHDSYVKNTLYNKTFYANYTNKDYQKEWMAKATKYMLKKWKVTEEKTIEVISGSKALVQAIEESRGGFTKSGFKKSYDKLVKLEEELVEKHGARLGSAVRYEDYKRLEKDFFSKK